MCAALDAVRRATLALPAAFISEGGSWAVSLRLLLLFLSNLSMIEGWHSKVKGVEPMTLRYKGNPKHKRWGSGHKGTICPDWTHETVPASEAGNKADVDKHDWPATLAQELLDKSIADGRKRYATARKSVFCAQSANDGTWHGYPVSWIEVPQNVIDELIDAGEITREDMRRQSKKELKLK